MTIFRQIIKWVSQHRVISILGTLLLSAAFAMALVIQRRSNGTLTAPLAKGSIIESVYGIGTVMSNRNFQLKLGVITHINELWIKEGDTVQRGQRLTNIDGVVYRAPFDGTITSLPFNIGENAFSQLPILSLVDLRDRYLVVSLEQQGALRIKKGQRAKMSFDTIREQNYDGTVQAVYSNAGTFLARIDVSMLPASILPGMTADIAITIREHDDVLLVPVAALDQGQVWVKRGRGIPHAVPVKTGIIDRDLAEISSGEVQAGDRLLIRRKPGP